MTPLLFSAGSPILSIVPPMRSSRSPSATSRCSRRPFQKYSTSSMSRPRRTLATNASSSLSFSAGASNPTRTPAGTPGASSPASAIDLQPVGAGEEDPLGRPPAGDLRAERHMPGGVQRRQRMRRELRERAAARHGVAERRHLRHVPGFGEEDALACRRAQHGRVEGDLTARVDRRDDRLRR